jgi:hypothetical protein
MNLSTQISIFTIIMLFLANPALAQSGGGGGGGGALAIFALPILCVCSPCILAFYIYYRCKTKREKAQFLALTTGKPEHCDFVPPSGHWSGHYWQDGRTHHMSVEMTFVYQKVDNLGVSHYTVFGKGCDELGTFMFQDGECRVGGSDIRYWFTKEYSTQAVKGNNAATFLTYRGTSSANSFTIDGVWTAGMITPESGFFVLSPSGTLSTQDTGTSEYEPTATPDGSTIV